ncbi:leucine-rich PPR motif-containing protein, mitochondrial [Tribolium castaneum]|uniref:Leucine-rich PPR motif-containing protein, mitochondrial-like Protein n=1 Tax=Tribolium castaneum TaxID=7070 RepID=D2A3F7_TRICA|nr:PREDICTED: leucine-rich PPR motif-containing protein, mitochondrial [Tribolium castaneum]EFA01919.1 Leucine-rich PPR motif-containing protein, mitochondrial-like Protein [Tribolium castaneum]|eukprot:XP_975329.1 PREDICTED: leucine-rich PPR motif-containing protein, mitochondrial [Tribolium castaneum]
MASILRSSKFVRYIAGFARNVVLNTPREFDGNLVNTTQCLCGAVPRSFASQIPAPHDQNLETSLRRLDQDVRKVGRISRRDIEDVLDEIRSSRSATSSQSLLVIRCCGNLVPEELPEVRTKLVQEIWATLNKLNVPMDISHYNALLRVYLENEHQFSPAEFLADLESKGIEPNRVTYQRLIARYCQVGDIEGATKILEFMKEKQLPVNENVFNALIVGHSQTGDMDSAQGILGVMTQAGLEPSADTYTTLLCGFGKKGDIDAINKLFEECESKEIYLLDKDYLDIVYALATNGHSEHIPQILSKVRRAIGYNQDAINLILRLINKGLEDAAFPVLETVVRSTNPDGTHNPVGNFFVKQMVKANRPVEKIIEMCNKLESSGMYTRGLSLAAETSLEFGNDQLAYSLLTELSKKDIPVRQHYFWPLIVAKSKDSSGQGILDVLLSMHKFNITPSNETLREYVIPNLKAPSSEILSILRSANVPLGTSGACLVHHLLNKSDIKEAAIISTQVSAFYNPDLLKRPLTNSFYKNKDLESYIRIVRNIYDNLDRLKRSEEDEPTQVADKNEVVGNLVLDLSWNREFLNVVEDVLKGLISEGLSISTTAAEKLQEKLGEKMTEEISSLLGKLTSGHLTPVPVPKKLPSYTPSHQMNVEQLERLIHNLEVKNQDTKGLKRQLLTLYYREKDLEKTESLLAELEKTDFVYSAGIYAQLSDLYAHHDKLDKAMEYYNKLKELEGNEFKMDETKIVSIAHLLVRNGKFDQAIEIIEKTPRENLREERTYNYAAQVWRLLNSLAEEGRVDEVNKLFDTLVKNDFIEVNNILLGPLVKVHLVNKDIDKAMEKFEWCVNQFRATPWKNELACQLIQKEDAEKLQKLTDLSTSIHGEINSLYDLVFAFVECGRVRQARKILETPGLQTRPQRINIRCERYRQEGQVKPLESLKDATKDLDHINRSDIYYQLLLSYIKQEEVEKALGLWTQMQEEDLLPSDEFLQSLGKFLQDKGVSVPFQIPQSVTPPQVVEKSHIQQFRRKLKEGDVQSALQFYNPNDHSFTVTDTSLLIEKLIQNNRIGEATKVTLNLLETGATPLARVFKFLLNKLANAGDLDSLAIIDKKVSQEVKKTISFDNRVCHANLIAGKAPQYLDQLENEIDNAKDEDLKAIEEKFPRGGAYGILERHPQLLEKYENLAVKYAQRGIVAPMNVLWTNYFIVGNEPKAEQIWNTYLKGAPRIMFQRIVHAARETQDENLIKKLIKHLKNSNVTEGAVGNAYSCLLDVLVAKNNTEEVVLAFELALKDAGLNHLNRTAILRVKEVYEKLGKPFDYAIPPKNPRIATSTSSGEEDAKK